MEKDIKAFDDAKELLTEDELIDIIVTEGEAEKKIPCDDNEERLVKSILKILLNKGLSARRTKAILDYVKTLVDIVSRFEY